MSTTNVHSKPDGNQSISRYEVNSLQETFDLAEKLSLVFHPGHAIALIGDMGAGKTAFVRGFLLALGFEGVVRSPSFTIVNVYTSIPKVVHVDLYRLNAPEEMVALALDELRENAILFVEWGDRFQEEWGPVTHSMTFETPDGDPDQRVITVEQIA